MVKCCYSIFYFVKWKYTNIHNKWKLQSDQWYELFWTSLKGDCITGPVDPYKITDYLQDIPSSIMFISKIDAFWFYIKKYMNIDYEVPIEVYNIYRVSVRLTVLFWVNAIFYWIIDKYKFWKIIIEPIEHCQKIKKYCTVEASDG